MPTCDSNRCKPVQISTDPQTYALYSQSCIKRNSCNVIPTVYADNNRCYGWSLVTHVGYMNELKFRLHARTHAHTRVHIPISLHRHFFWLLFFHPLLYFFTYTHTHILMLRDSPVSKWLVGFELNDQGYIPSMERGIILFANASRLVLGPIQFTIHLVRG